MKVAVMVWTLKGLGSVSNPNMVTGLANVSVTLEEPLVQRTLGVLVSVFGGEFQVAHVVGTVPACIAVEKVTVWLPFVKEVMFVKSGCVIGRRLVELV
jgi:hypothetical protein